MKQIIGVEETQDWGMTRQKIGANETKDLGRQEKRLYFWATGMLIIWGEEGMNGLNKWGGGALVQREKLEEGEVLCVR